MRLSHILPTLALAVSLAAHAAPKPACDLLTPDEASAALGVAAKPGVAAIPGNCRFLAASGDAVATLTVSAADPRGSAMSMDFLVKSSSDAQKASPVPGVGEKAVFSTDIGGGMGILVLINSTRISLNLNGLPPGQNLDARRDALIKAAKLIISRL